MSVNYGKNLISYMQRHFVNKSNTVLTISFNFSDDIPIIKSSFNNDMSIEKTPLSIEVSEDSVSTMYLDLYYDLKDIYMETSMSTMNLLVFMNLSTKEPSLLIEIKELRNNKMYIVLDNYKLANIAIHEIANDWEEMLQVKRK